MRASLTSGVDPRTLRRGVRWLQRQRATFRPRGRPLAEAEHRLYAPYFPRRLLRAARVAVVERLQRPDVSDTPPHLRLATLIDVAGVEAFAFVDTIVLVRRNMPSPERIAGVLFHELVHLEQMRRLGVPGFVRAYLQGWLEAAGDYESIPLESHAYTLETSFDRGHLVPAPVGRVPGAGPGLRA